MKPSIKFSTNFIALLANSQIFFRNFVASNLFCVSFSKFNHVFTMTFFNDKIWKNLLAYVEQTVSSCNPIEYFSLKFSRRSAPTDSRSCSTKGTSKPIHDAFSSIRYLKKSSIMSIDISVTRSFFDDCHKKTSFPIDNSGHVGKIGRVIKFWNIIFRSSVVFSLRFFHKATPLQKCSMMINEVRNYVQVERLSVLDSKEYATV